MRFAVGMLALVFLLLACSRTAQEPGVEAKADGSPFGGEARACSVDCQPGQTCCGKLCANLDYNPGNCGSCGHACTYKEICDRGNCVTPASCNPQDPDASACSAEACCNGYMCCPAGTRCVPAGVELKTCCPIGDKCSCNPHCPISSAKHKREIRYLTPAELERVERDLLSLRLATYRYRGPLDDGRSHLGFILEDSPEAPAADLANERVDLYSYASMAVAALQTERRASETLRRRVDALEERLTALERQKGR